MGHGDALERGQSLGRYVILDPLGSGGMGMVYEAFDPELERKVALKVLHGGGTVTDSLGQPALLREAQAMARLTHPNVVAVHDVGTVNDQVFIAMELVRGGSLRQWLRRSDRGWREVTECFVGAGRGLAAAHAAGMVHRDFKPDNVLIGDDARPRVGDFGLARVTRTGGSDDTETSSGGMGTPAYMSPEQHLGEEVGPASDQFSFCVALFEAIYGRRPFQGSSLAELTMNVVEGKLDLPRSGTTVPVRLRRAVLRGLSRKPADRFASMDALLVELESHVRRRARLWLAGAAIAVVAGGTGAWLSAGAGPTPCSGAETELHEAWDEGRRTRLIAAFEGVRLPMAKTAAERAANALDRYAARWVSAHREACEATSVHRTQSSELLDRRMACLDGRRRRLARLVDVLHEVDATGVRKAQEAIARLPDTDACGDLDRLLDQEPIDLSDPAQRELADALARIQALRTTGKLAKALEVAAPVVTRAREIASPPLLAEILTTRGEIQLDVQDMTAATETLHEAIWAAERARRDDLRVRGWIAMVASSPLDAEGLTRAERLGGHARAVLERIGGDARLESSLEDRLGIIAYRSSRLEDAERHYQASLEALRRAGVTEGPLVANTLNNLGLALRDMGRPDEAETTLKRSRDDWARGFGEGHPDVAVARMNLGTLHDTFGRHEQALVEYRAALAVFRDSIGPRTHDVATAHDLIALANGYLERHEEALEHHREAQAIFSALGMEGHPDMAASLDNEGVVLGMQGRFPEAAAAHERALSIWEGSLGPEHPDLVYALVHLAYARRDMGDATAAIAALERGLKILAGRSGLPELEADVSWTLARLVQDRDPKRAMTLARRAHRVFAASGAAGNDAVAAKIASWIAGRE